VSVTILADEGSGIPTSKVYMNLYVRRDLRDCLDRLARREKSNRSAICEVLLLAMLKQLGEIPEFARACVTPNGSTNSTAL
jgi:hypothetical protein